MGGTFTDFILYDGQEGSVRLHKRLTTPHDPPPPPCWGWRNWWPWAASAWAMWARSSTAPRWSPMRSSSARAPRSA
ncbi:hypothetical protein ACFQU7_10570 [Pseudoroseomonas wenyumeiae]